MQLGNRQKNKVGIQISVFGGTRNIREIKFVCGTNIGFLSLSLREISLLVISREVE